MLALIVGVVIVASLLLLAWIPSVIEVGPTGSKLILGSWVSLSVMLLGFVGATMTMVGAVFQATMWLFLYAMVFPLLIGFMVWRWIKH
jgi:hypothetical protein